MDGLVEATNQTEGGFKKESKNEEEEEEDIPADFFDEFLTDDFMDGLDIVDACGGDGDAEEVNSKSNLESKEEVGKSSKKRIVAPSPSKNKKSHQSKVSDLRDRIKNRRRSHRSKSKTKDRKRRSLSNDVRRDPEKTKRDIQRDKVKCAKNEEFRIISEKLKVVETGLVPPGTEMDVDIVSMESLHEKKEKPHKKKIRDSPPKPKKRSISPDLFDLTSKHRRRRSSSRRRSHHRRSRSLEIRRRSRREISRSPLRSRRKSRSFSPARKYRDRSHSDRNRKTRSPPSKRKSKSPPSERELWLRNDLPPTGNFNPQSNLYPPQQPTYVPPQAAPVYNPPPPNFNNYYPQPVPEPIQYHSAVPPYNQFNGEVAMPVPYPNMGYEPNFPLNPPTQFSAPQSLPLSNFQSMILPSQPNSTVDTATKLFESKKISLSDYLAMVTKDSGAGNPVNLTKKISVIALCQDAISMLSKTSKLRGRFFAKTSGQKTDFIEHESYKSPLRKKISVRFTFTQNRMRTSPVQETLRKLLLSLRVMELAPQRLQPIAPPAPFISGQFVVPQPVPPPGPRKVTIATQTFFKCADCEVRNSRKFADKEVECKPTMSFAVTQVTADDLQNTAAVELSQYDSLARLTPAQILGRNMDKYGTNMEVDIRSLKSRAAIFNNQNRGGFSQAPRNFPPSRSGYQENMRLEPPNPYRPNDFYDLNYHKF